MNELKSRIFLFINLSFVLDKWGENISERERERELVVVDFMRVELKFRCQTKPN